MTPGVDDTLHEVVVHMRQQQQQVLNVWQFRNETAVDDMEVRLLRALMLCYIEVLLPGLGSKLTLEKVTGMQVGPTLGPIYEIGPEEGDVIVGAAAGDTLPTHDSICANIHTVRPGRSGRGRKFIPGIPEGATDGSNVTTTSAAWLAVVAFLACVGTKFIHGTELAGPNTISLGVIAKSLQTPNAEGKKLAPWPLDLFSRATRMTAKPIVGTTNSRKIGRGA